MKLLIILLLFILAVVFAVWGAVDIVASDSVTGVCNALI